MTSSCACDRGSIAAPIDSTMGRMTIAPTVCDTKVVATSTSAQSAASVPQGLSPAAAAAEAAAEATECSSPDESTAAPRARPPWASMTTVQSIELKSSLVRTPGAEERDERQRRGDAHPAQLVLEAGVGAPERDGGRADGDDVDLHAREALRRGAGLPRQRPHRRAPRRRVRQQQRAPARHDAAARPRAAPPRTTPATQGLAPPPAAAAACAILSIAKTFCGDEIGVVIPPRFDASATPSASARPRWSPALAHPRGGSVRSTGASSE